MCQKPTENAYGPEDIAARLSRDLPRWTFKDGCLCRTYQTRKWPETLMLFNAIGYLAEKTDHHPDITASYASLDIRLMTHSAGGITDKDFELARAIESLAV